MSRDPRVDSDVPPALRRDDGGLLTQRVRVGAIGLASVFLLVLLAASVFGLIGGSQTPSGQTTDDNGAATLNGEEPPKEPLAELGVAPGNAPEHPAENASAPQAGHSRPIR